MVHNMGRIIKGKNNFCHNFYVPKQRRLNETALLGKTAER